MATIIGQGHRVKQEIPKIIYDVCPPELCIALEKMVFEGVPIDEIRLRTDRLITVTSGGKNIPLDIRLGKGVIDGIVDVLCDGSLYAHADTISKGYITSNGIRVGIVGRAAVEGERIIGVYDVSALCFRLPRRIRHVGEPICRLLRELDGESGVLVYSLPGQGKTTLLGSVCYALATGDDAWRVAVVDTRGELGYSLCEGDAMVDVLTGYPRGLGLEIAARTMNAQLCVCDEIGSVAEAESIIAVQNCGVPLLATAHADSIDMLLRRTGILSLHRARIFGAYVGISRRGEDRDYTYRITYWEDADELVANDRCGCGRA